MTAFSRICVFCGSSPGNSQVFKLGGEAVAALLARHKIGLVYGGGRAGIMGIVADAAMAAGVDTIGVIPRFLLDLELGHNGLTRLEVVETMHERKARMASLADAFIALPGGFGTLEELLEAVTWSLLGLHPKPCGVLNIDHFFDPLLAQVDNCIRCGFLAPQFRELILSAEEPEELLSKLEAYKALPMKTWEDLEKI